MSITPIKSSNRSPREFRAGIPPGLPQYNTVLVHHNPQNIMETDISESYQYYLTLTKAMMKYPE
jgi:hypothetical protein